MSRDRTVPLVIGMSVDQATETLLSTALRVTTAEEDGGSTPRGTVITQTPIAGTRVPRGATISLVVVRS